MPQPGRQVNLFMNLGSTSVPNWIAAGQATSLDSSAQRDTQRVNHKDSNESIPISGSISRSYSLAGFYFRNDAVQAAMKLAFQTDTEKQYRVVDTGAPTEQFFGKITAFNASHPVDGASTYNITLEPTETPYNPGS